MYTVFRDRPSNICAKMCIRDRADTEKLKNAYAAEYEKNRSALESTYNAGCSSWVDAIVENCTRVN